MRIRLELEPENGEVVVPVHYNYMVQGLIYRYIDPDLATWLHEQGFSAKGRPFKLFTFSRLFGAFRRAGDRLVYRGPLGLYIGSPIANFVESLAQNLVRVGSVPLGDGYLRLSSISVEMPPDVSEVLKVRALSPITVYSTVPMPDGRKLTYYYSPWEQPFSQQIATNLMKKYELIEGRLPDPAWTFEVKPWKVYKHNQVIVKYKGTVIKGWTGTYWLQGAPQLLEVALQTGLGSKNSQGFGMIEPVSDSTVPVDHRGKPARNGRYRPNTKGWEAKECSRQ